MTDSAEVQTVQITTRIKGELADRLFAIADSERRSMANLLLLAVEQFVETYEKNLSQGG